MAADQNVTRFIALLVKLDAEATNLVRPKPRWILMPRLRAQLGNVALAEYQFSNVAEGTERFRDLCNVCWPLDAE